MAEWDIDLSEVDGLKRWYGKQPKLMQRASAMLLNNFAFGVRDEAITQIGRLMIVRNPGFVRRQLRVTKTTYSTPISRQRSMTGSMAIKGQTRRGDFTGWAEQEKGTPVQRQRVSALASRSGDIRKQMLHRARLKPANTVTDLSKMNQRGGSGNFGGAVAMLMRQKYKGLIKLKGHFFLLPGKGGGFVGPSRMGAAGNYRVATGLVKSLQLVQVKKHKQPKQKHWLRIARAVYFRKNPPQETWNKTVTRMMTPPPKR